MIDSGTTYTYIISSEYKVLHSALVVEINNVMSQHHVQFPTVTRPRVSSHSLYLIFIRNMIVTDFVLKKIFQYSHFYN